MDQPYGPEAAGATERTALGAEVRVFVVDEDRWGRLVGVVLLGDGGLLNHMLVRGGHAWWYRRYAPGSAVFRALEEDARARRRGLWAGRNPVAPWDFRSGG